MAGPHERTHTTTYTCCTPQSGGVAGDPTEVSPVSLLAIYFQGGKLCMCEMIKEYVIVCKRIILCRVKYYGRNVKDTTCLQGGEVNLTNDLAWNKIKVNTSYLISSSGISRTPATAGVLTVPETCESKNTGRCTCCPVSNLFWLPLYFLVQNGTSRMAPLWSCTRPSAAVNAFSWCHKQELVFNFRFCSLLVVSNTCQISVC